jgi:hypothetical protein
MPMPPPPSRRARFGKAGKQKDAGMAPAAPLVTGKAPSGGEPVKRGFPLPSPPKKGPVPPRKPGRARPPAPSGPPGFGLR